MPTRFSCCNALPIDYNAAMADPKQSSIPDTIRELETQRSDLVVQIKQIDDVIAALKTLGKTKASPTGVQRIEIRQPQTIGGLPLIPIRAIPIEIETAVREYIAGTTQCRFSMSVMRAALQKPPYSLKEDQIGFNVSVAMRKLEAENVIKTIQRGKGRRDAIYEKIVATSNAQ